MAGNYQLEFFMNVLFFIESISGPLKYLSNTAYG
jgi:hypothetical protein